MKPPTPPALTLEIRLDRDAAPGNTLRPLVALLRQLARRRRPAPPDIHGTKETRDVAEKPASLT
jgi:hypothetical protein